MPVVLVPFVPIIAIIAIAALAALASILLRPLLVWLAENLPVVGGVIGRGIRRIEISVRNAWDDYVAANARGVVRWFYGVASTIEALPAELAGLAGDLKDALEYVANVLIVRKARAIAAPIVRAVDRIEATLTREVGDLWTGIRADRARIRQLTRQVWERAIAPFVAFKAAAEARLRQLTELIWSRAIVPVVTVVLPRLRGVEVEIGGLRRRVGELARGLRHAQDWLLPISAVFTAAAVVSLLRHVRRCRPKTERLCRMDLDGLDDLAGVAFLALSMRELIQLVEGAQGIAEAHADLVSRLIRED